jgi:Icc-related predicted phosphoesterase
MLAGDVHGAIEDLGVKARELGADLVLQVGDLGLYRDYNSIDQKSRKHFDKDKVKRGQCFRYTNGELTFPVPLYFVRGNHEDFGLLKEGRFPDNINYLYSGIWALEGTPGAVAALGGIWYQGNHLERKFYPKYTQKEDVDSLLRSTAIKPTLLLTHDCPINTYPEVRRWHGSPYVNQILDTLKPKYVIHGHYHYPTRVYQYNEHTVGIGLGYEDVMMWDTKEEIKVED